MVVEDIADPAIVAATERAVANAFAAAGVEGSWVVAIAASDTRGRWDIGLRGPRGSHLLSFVASPSQVPEYAARYVTRTLARLTGR